MRFFAYTALAALLLGFGVWRVAVSILCHDRYLGGNQSLRQIRKGYRSKQELWDLPLFQKAVGTLSRLVYLDELTRNDLERRLHRAGMTLTPEEYSARKYCYFVLCGLGTAFCALLKFWLGLALCVLLLIYSLMRHREALTKRIKARDEAIQLEMPRFVRTVCRSLKSSRDIYAALSSYYTVAGPALKEEIYILLTQMRNGNVAVALQEFQRRIGTDAAFRFSSTLQELDRGVDQTSALEYLANDMAQSARLAIQKKLSTRPGQMRMTYLPAVGVCIIMIIYVLIVFVMDQLNNLY